VRQLIDAGWTASDEDLAVLLRNALETDDVAELTEALGAGADPNTTYAEERLPALTLARSASAVRILLHAGANPSARSRGGVTALVVATSLDPEITALLLKAGVVVDESYDADGRTALWQAACVGNAGVVSLLLKSGANPHVSVAGLTAAECARGRRKRAEGLSLTPRPASVYKPAFVEDLDRTIALFDEVVGTTKHRD
jgi:ankyrin repeat protein